MLNKSFLKKLIKAVKEPEDLILTFTYQLNSQDWDGGEGTVFSYEDTKDTLIQDLDDHLQELSTQCLNPEYIKIQTVKEARLKELWDQAQEKYNEIHGKENVLEALDSHEKTEYAKLDFEVNG